jgi:2'-5' RNA ligase
VRLFVALEVPEDLRRRLAGVRERVGTPGGGLRWMSAATLHLTLRFLGETPSHLISVLNEALAGVESERLLVRVRGLGFFPSQRAPRVLWARAESPGLGQLHDGIEAAAASRGWPRESRPFHPHLTLARAPGGRTMDRALTGALDPMRGESGGEFAASSFALFSSRSGHGGAVHAKQAEFVFVRE